jgi:Zn-dependent protease with chaperone function
VTRDEFDLLVRRLEVISGRHHGLYVARVVGLLTLAYGYLGLVLLGSLALAAGTIALVVVAHNGAIIKPALFVIIGAGGMFWAVLRGLWVTLKLPEGQSVTRVQAPQLFAMLDELRAALDCRPFHRVLLVPEHNPAVVQIPRLGVFGWHRNYLLLGLPLMESLDPDEFKAVLAHEFAHSSRGHGRFGNWLYRVRRSWDRIFEQIARQRTRGGFVLVRFINWFWPLFNAHAFVLARANEYEADACSVRLAGADAAARALIRLPVDESLLSEQFWPHVFSRANQDAAPPSDVMRSLGQALRSGAPTEDGARWLRQAFLVETSNNDTHPCLKDRLRAMGRLPDAVNRGEFPPVPPPPTQTAAAFFLGSHAETAAREMSDRWQQAIAGQWPPATSRRGSSRRNWMR